MQLRLSSYPLQISILPFSHSRDMLLTGMKILVIRKIPFLAQIHPRPDHKLMARNL